MKCLKTFIIAVLKKIIGEIHLHVQENMNKMVLATCVIGEKTLDVLNTEGHIFVYKIRNSILKYLDLDYETEAILNQIICFIKQHLVRYDFKKT